MDETPNPGGQVGDTAHGDGDLLNDPRHVRADARTIQRAIRNGWPITPEMKGRLVKRMDAIIGKTVVLLPGKEADEATEYHADSNAIAAARVLVAANAQTQTDDQEDNKNERLDKGLNTEKTIVEVVHVRRAPPTEG